MTRSKTVATLAAAGLVLALGVGEAFAAPGYATGTVNIRTGPGTSNAKVGVLRAGEAVDVGECRSGWCHITHDGPDGWVSANYLGQGRGSSGGRNNDPDIGFQFGVGPDGPSFGFSIGDGRHGRFPAPPMQRGRACFFSDNNFSGRSFCVNAGGSLAQVPRGWNDRISSVSLDGVHSVTMCKDYGYGGYCRTTRRDEPALGPFLNDQISSVRVR
jgi:uncharacterized protein YraI